MDLPTTNSSVKPGDDHLQNTNGLKINHPCFDDGLEISDMETFQAMAIIAHQYRQLLEEEPSLESAARISGILEIGQYDPHLSQMLNHIDESIMEPIVDRTASSP